jgi:hypothetical protein
VIASGRLIHAKAMSSGALSIVAFGIVLDSPKHDDVLRERRRLK